MKLLAIGIIILGLLIIIYPELVAYIIGGFLIIIGFNIFYWTNKFEKKSKQFQKDFDVFGYKVYKKKN